MTAAEARELYAYDRWANDLILQCVASLTPEQFVQDMKSSYASVRDTLVHILAAEWVWLSRWNGVSPRAFPEGWDRFTFTELRARWQQHEAEQSAFLARLTDADVTRPIGYTNLSGAAFEVPLGHLLRHVINHSAYHRGQVVTMLRQLGVTPPATDLVRYYTSPPVAAVPAR